MSDKLQQQLDRLAHNRLVSKAVNERKRNLAAIRAKHDLEALHAPAPLSVNANISEDQQRQIDLATEQFKQSVKRVDNQILSQYVQAVQNGDYAEAQAILQNAVESQQTNTLAFALLTIGVILLPLYARQRLQSLYTQFGMKAVFAQTDDAKKALQEQARKGAESHVQTIVKDLQSILDVAIDEELPSVQAGMEERFPELKGKTQKDYLKEVASNKEMYTYAQRLILGGASKDVVIKKLQERFDEINPRRANVIAGNEANRIFTLSQFEADAQFLAQNKMTKNAYKRLVSNTGHPCPICDSLIKATHASPIPFKQDFAEFGKEMQVKTETGKVLKFTPNYEHLKSGHIHVNCHCRYELLIKREDGTWLNSNTGKVINEINWDEGAHPRWPKGTPKGGKFMKMADIDVSAHINNGAEILGNLRTAIENLDWANSGFGDAEQAKRDVEEVKMHMSQLYRKAFADNGLTIDHYAKLKRDQLDYSGGGDVRDKDGKYLTTPELQKPSAAGMVHTKLTQEILKKANTHINLYRGEGDFKNPAQGIVSYTDTKAIAGNFGKVQTKMTSVEDIRYHYLLDFDSVHSTENEVIVQQ